MTFRFLKKFTLYTQPIAERSALIGILDVGKSVMVASGLRLVACIVRYDMVKFCFGDFIFTRRMGKIHSLEKKPNIIGGKLTRKTRSHTARPKPVQLSSLSDKAY